MILYSMLWITVVVLSISFFTLYILDIYILHRYDIGGAYYINRFNGGISIEQSDIIGNKALVTGGNACVLSTYSYIHAYIHTYIRTCMDAYKFAVLLHILVHALCCKDRS